MMVFSSVSVVTATNDEVLEEATPDYPQITKVETTKNGIRISYSEYDGAYRYRVFIKRTDSSGWKTIGETAKTEFVHTAVNNDTEYIYTVRAIDANKQFMSAYDKQGVSFRYYDTPVIGAFESTNGGLKMNWSAVEGAKNYKVYVKQSNGWRALGFTTKTSFVFDEAKSGTAYTMTVRCVSEDSKELLSHFDTKGKTATYIGTPQITKVENVANGTKITWDKVTGAYRYRLFYKRTDGKGWKTIANTTATSYTHQPLSNGAKFIYTVRVLNGYNQYCSGYDSKGTENVFLSYPELTSVTAASDGLKVNFKKVEGATDYKVYVKQSNGWKALGFTQDNYFVDTTAKSGTSYTYTVRCVSADHKNFTSYFDKKGVTGKYIATPQITKVENTENGAKVYWDKVDGISKYRLFYKRTDGNGWKTIANTTDTSYTHAPLNDGDTYTYTVRGLDSKGNYISSYNSTGTFNEFIAPPQIDSVEKIDETMLLRWDSVKAASGYRVYRKVFTQSWEGIGNTDLNEFVDENAPTEVPYTYTIRCIDENEEPISYYVSYDKYFVNGELADGQIIYNGASYYFVDGHLRQGYVTINDKTYYYDAEGNVMKNGIVGSEKEGYCYANDQGVIDYSVRKAVTDKGADWNVIEGKAYKVKTEADRTLFRAFKEVDKALSGKKNLTKAQKLRACFDYVKDAYIEKNPRIPHYNGMDWPIIYANDMFVRGTGNCFSYGACFAYMAKALGYEEVYACHSGGHGWAEVDGLVYDPEWSRHHARDYYAISYNDRTCDVDYKGAMAVKLPWKHIKI